MSGFCEEHDDVYSDCLVCETERLKAEIARLREENERLNGLRLQAEARVERLEGERDEARKKAEGWRGACANRIGVSPRCLAYSFSWERAALSGEDAGEMGLREKIERMPGLTANVRMSEDEPELIPDPDGPWVMKSDVLALLSPPPEPESHDHACPKCLSSVAGCECSGDWRCPNGCEPEPAEECGTCGGERMIRNYAPDFYGDHHERACPDCGGEGEG